MTKKNGSWKVGTAKAKDGTTGKNPCLCGCGTKVRGRFAQGHDARVRGWLLSGAKLPSLTRAAVKAGVIRQASERTSRVLVQQKRKAA